MSNEEKDVNQETEGTSSNPEEDVTSENSEVAETEESADTVPQTVSMDEYNRLKTSMETRLGEMSQDKDKIQSLLQNIMTNNSDEDEEEEESDPQTRRLKKALSQQQNDNRHLRSVVGGLAEEMDLLSIKQSPLFKLYNKYSTEVENLRKHQSSYGKYFKREEALALVMAQKGDFDTGKALDRPKIIKQTVKPLGESKSSVPSKSKEEKKEQTLRERLQGKSF